MKAKRTLRNIIAEVLDQQTATSIEPVMKKYLDRATQDKSPDVQALQRVMQEIAAAKKPVQQQQPAQQQQQSLQQQNAQQGQVAQQANSSVETADINKAKQNVANLNKVKSELNLNVDNMIKNQTEEQKKKEEELKQKKAEELKKQSQNPNGNATETAQLSSTGSSAQMNTTGQTAQSSVAAEFNY